MRRSWVTGTPPFLFNTTYRDAMLLTCLQKQRNVDRSVLPTANENFNLRDQNWLFTFDNYDNLRNLIHSRNEHHTEKQSSHPVEQKANGPLAFEVTVGDEP